MSAKILLVDDETDMLEMMVYNLGAQGYRILTAVTGLDALNKARLNALSVGADDFLSKPFSPQELIRRVRELLDLRGTRPVQGKAPKETSI